MTHTCIAFLTDFGTRDHYVGAMKGAALGICPDATLLDLTHDIPPHDITAGALELAAVYRYFPAGTIFVAVVDPGVGSGRKGIAAEAGGYRFVAPDNGLLTRVFHAHPPRRVIDLTEQSFARQPVSRTFEARDRFAPAAAWLAKGVDLSALGRPVSTWVRLELNEPVVTTSGIDGEVWRVDRFGNLITNIERVLCDREMIGAGITIAIGRDVLRCLVGTYADVDAGALCALFSSTGHLEIAVNGSSAADRLGLGRGARVTVDRE